MPVTSVGTGISQEISQIVSEFVFGDKAIKYQMFACVCGNDVQSGNPLLYQKSCPKQPFNFLLKLSGYWLC